MATTITPQALPANGQPVNVNLIAADDTGMSFPNSGREILLVAAGSAPAAADVIVEGVPAADSGRDGTVTFGGALVADELVAGGPFKPRNFNNGGIIELTIGAAATLSVGVVRFDPNG